MLASSSLNNLFVTFYLDLFMGVSHLSPTTFYVGQTLYLLWNAVNDPLFGWLQDVAGSRRLTVVKLGGCCWAFAFVLVWYPPETEWYRGVHFVLTTCLYDAMLTLVEIAHSALLAEITRDDKERAAFNGYSAAFAGIGSLTSFAGQWYWDASDLKYFRFACLAIAGVCVLIFVHSSTVLQEKVVVVVPSRSSTATTITTTTPITPVTPSATTTTTSTSTTTTTASSSSSTTNGGTGVLHFISQLRQQKNFFVYVGVASTQSFDCSFEKSSFVLFLAALAGDALSKSQKALTVSGSFFLPWLITLAATPLIQQQGVYRVLGSIFFARCVVCCIALVLFLLHGISANNEYGSFSILFLLMNRVMSESVCRISPLVISDLVDEDRFIHKRKDTETRSGTIVGSVNFFTKLTQSVGPMVGYYILNAGRRADHGPLGSWLRLDLSLSAVPLCCASLQLILWAGWFTLHGNHLKRVKSYLEEIGGGSGALMV